MLSHTVCCAGMWRFSGSAQLLLQPQDTAVTLDSCLMDFWFFLGRGVVCTTCNRQRDFPAWCLARGVKSLCTTYFAFIPQRQLGPCMGNPFLSMEQGPGSSGASGVHAAHLSPCRNVMHCWLISFLPHIASFVSLNHRAKGAWSQTPVLGSLSPRLRVFSAVCSCDSPCLLQKGDCVLWHRAWQQQRWGHEKQQQQSTIQWYNRGDILKLHVHIWYGLSKQKTLLNIWSAWKKQLADAHI